LCQQYNTAIVFGAYALLKFEAPNRPRMCGTPRTSTHRTVRRRDTTRSISSRSARCCVQAIDPWLYNLLWRFAAYSVEYPITGADETDATLAVFTLHRARPGAPSVGWCRPFALRIPTGPGRADVSPQRPGARARKRADVLVNVTNDGWFRGDEKWQHFQSAIFRSIETACRRQGPTTPGSAGS
jgi:hypothetical protein